MPMIDQYIRQKSAPNYLHARDIPPSIVNGGAKAANDLAVAIQHISLQEQTKKFGDSLIRAIQPFVFSADRLTELRREILEDQKIVPEEIETYIFQQAANQFRQDNIAGQLGELILYIILEEYYRAIPVVRKMTISTNPKLERNGADAIHLRFQNGEYEVVIGEAKTYLTGKRVNSPGYDGFVDAIESAIESYDNLWSETEAYISADYIPKNIKDVIRKIRNGEIEASILICCICAFEQPAPNASSDKKMIEDMHAQAEALIQKIMGSKKYSDIPARLKPKFSFISFPITNLKYLKERFSWQL